MCSSSINRTPYAPMAKARSATVSTATYGLATCESFIQQRKPGGALCISGSPTSGLQVADRVSHQRALSEQEVGAIGRVAPGSGPPGSHPRGAWAHCLQRRVGARAQLRCLFLFPPLVDEVWRPALTHPHLSCLSGKFLAFYLISSLLFSVLTLTPVSFWFFSSCFDVFSVTSKTKKKERQMKNSSFKISWFVYSIHFFYVSSVLLQELVFSPQWLVLLLRPCLPLLINTHLGHQPPGLQHSACPAFLWGTTHLNP